MAIDTSYGATIGRVASVMPPLVDALQTGIDLANEYWMRFGWRRHHYPQLWSHLVRTHALGRLGEAGFVADVDDDEGAGTTPPMSALLIEHGQDILKVRLSQDGKVPLPGPSAALTNYYRQHPQLPGLETKNLVVLWRHEHGRLVEPLTLVRPLDGGRSERDLVLGWVGPVDRGMVRLRAADLDELRPLFEQPALGSDDTG
ncbi:MAG TPA: hypothetical protein VNQ77_03045 [Frankiaceae bacterium]|nr:hypothetical protein [Frankiaceae bacterium]